MEIFVDRGMVAIDEMKLKEAGNHFYVWAAIDVRIKEILAIRASWLRRMLDTYLLLKQVLKTCVNKPLILVGAMVSSGIT